LFIKGQNYNSHSSTLIDLHQKYVKIFDKILLKINFRGICCIDYKIVNNKPIIFEINPRFGGSAIYMLPEQTIDAYIKEVICRTYEKK
jgi:predicted ATP-grasp superfamily ATP-dependent carboligase